MTITVSGLNTHETAINAATTEAARQTAIAAYYQYLADEGISYGAIAKPITLESV